MSYFLLFLFLLVFVIIFPYLLYAFLLLWVLILIYRIGAVYRYRKRVASFQEEHHDRPQHPVSGDNVIDVTYTQREVNDEHEDQ